MSRPAAALFNLQELPLPAQFINAYEITNVGSLSWPVAIYKVDRIDGRPQCHEDRGQIKTVVWNLFREHKSRCSGFRFVIDIGKQMVAVPETWQLPSGATEGDYRIERIQSFEAEATNERHRSVVAGIIREALKRHFKEHRSDYLGVLWQDMDKFCQLPKPSDAKAYCMCRRFGAMARALRGNVWVVEPTLSTATVDGKTFAQYYREGKVKVLAQMMALKQGDKVDRQGHLVGVRALHDSSNEFNLKVTALEIEDPSVITGHAELSREEQESLSGGVILCRAFGREAEAVALSELRLILDSQITQDDHSETIIDPSERESLMRHLREFLNGADVFGIPLYLAPIPFDISRLPKGFIAPPAVRVMGRNGKETIVPSPPILSEDSLRKRTKDRADHVRRYGFLQQRPINPALAWPHHLGDKPAERMKADINAILADQGIAFTFQLIRYRDVEQIRKEVEGSGYDALLAVLPEGRLANYQDNSTHEQIKQRIEVPSQCIHYDHTLSSRLVTHSSDELHGSDAKLLKRAHQRYELCIASLLVKHHWIPFAPADPFNFNVHVGMDVGGTHNTDALSCIGYGFSRPEDGLLFRPDEIPIDIQKAEPIPTRSLYKGLLRQFETLRTELELVGRLADFERALFYRDGPLHGDGDAWNEKDALNQLHAELLSRGWVTNESVWTVIEIMKYAEGWRMFRANGGVINPLAGDYVFAFEDQNTALVCTTGSQYLTQGTACPLLVRVMDIHGRADRVEVIRDLVWQSDMCFTKPDIGMRLPWVLHVADIGALQQSRSYCITGITA